MNKSSNNWALMIAIIFASAAVSGSLVFFGMQLGGKASVMDWDKFVVKVGEGLEAYVEKQQAEQFAQQQEANGDKLEKAKEIRKYDASRDHLRGNADAEVTIYEYSDYVCPFCAKFQPIAQQALNEYQGKVNWVYRHWPLPGHEPIASIAAEGAECAAEMGGNDKFWAYTDAVLAAPSEGQNIGSLDDLASVVEKLGMNKEKFKECVESGKFADRVKEDYEEGGRIGVEGTPGNYVVNNKTGKILTIDGAQPISVVKLALDEALGTVK